MSALGQRLRATAASTGTIVLVFLAILVWIRFLNENFTDPPVFLNFVRRASPLMILAVGQLFVVAAGGFDLSVGSIVTATAVVAARYSDGDPANTWWLIILIVLGGALIGVVNGLVVTKLKVPSFIATLAMLLILDGAVRYWTGGAPRGALADNIRTFGRGGWEGVPWAETVPFAAVIMLAFAVGGSILLSRTDFGHQVLAVGGGPTTSALSGVHVHAVRIGTFVISGVCAAIAGILQSGITGVSDKVGAGLEFRAISAVVLGGAVLGGGKGVVSAAVIGALTLESIFTLLNLLRFSEGMRDTVQGIVIILAVALATLRERTRRASQTIAAATVAVESPSPSIRGSTA